MQPPSPDEVKAGVAGVFDRAAATYDAVGVDFFQPSGRFLTSRTDPRPGERVLDVGCGLGASAIPAAEAVGPTGSVLAIDLAPGMVERLRQAAASLPWLDARIGDAEAPPDGPFDVVQAGLVLFFLPSPETALARYREILAPGGRLGLTWFGAPDRRWEPVFRALVADVPTDQLPSEPVSRGPFATQEAMHELLAGLGWSDVTTETRTSVARVRDADHWFEWTWSQGYRFMLEKLEALGLLSEARERVRVLLDDMARRDGGLSWRAEVRATLARR